MKVVKGLTPMTVPVRDLFSIGDLYLIKYLEDVFCSLKILGISPVKRRPREDIRFIEHAEKVFGIEKTLSRFYDIEDLKKFGTPPKSLRRSSIHRRL